MKAEKGITLVALVITIIVLLILALVSIALVTNSGIISHAENAVDNYNEAQNNELKQINAATDKLDEVQAKLDAKS